LLLVAARGARGGKDGTGQAKILSEKGAVASG